QSRSDGQNQPMTSFAQSGASALTISRQALKCHELLVQDTRRPMADDVRSALPRSTQQLASRELTAATEIQRLDGCGYNSPCSDELTKSYPERGSPPP